MPKVVLRCTGDPNSDCNITVCRADDPEGIKYYHDKYEGIAMGYTQMKELLEYLGFEVFESHRV